MKSDLRPVNAELVRELKREGHFAEARDMVRAHLLSLKKDKKQVLSEIVRQDRLKAKVMGLCPVCMFRVAKNGSINCNVCSEQGRDVRINRVHYTMLKELSVVYDTKPKWLLDRIIRVFYEVVIDGEQERKVKGKGRRDS